MKFEAQFWPAIKPTNPENFFVYKAFFDGIESRIEPNGKSYASQSIELMQGWHQWLVKSYLVEKKLYNSFQSAINRYELDIFNFKKEYNLETDESKKQIIARKIANLGDIINKMKEEQSSHLKEVGNQVFINFEVL